MVGIVTQEYYFVVLDFKVKTTVYSTESFHAFFYLFIGDTAHLGQCHSCHSIFNINGNGHPQLNIINIAQWRNIVKEYFTASDTDILCMKVTFFFRIGI